MNIKKFLFFFCLILIDVIFYIKLHQSEFNKKHRDIYKLHKDFINLQIDKKFVLDQTGESVLIFRYIGHILYFKNYIKFKMKFK